MFFLQDNRLRAGVVIACIAIAGPVAAYYGAGNSAAPTSGCDQPKGCTVKGAEVDDAATLAARRAPGIGPASGLLADRRMASDIAAVGQLADGITVYSFKYLFEDQVRVGVFAQDLAGRPDTMTAVLRMANGLYGVDYAALGLRMATLAQWQQSGAAALQAGYKPQGRRAAKLNEPVKLTNRPPAY